MKKALVGYTGFVGSNLLNSTSFDGLYNSKNIKEAYGTKPDLLVYSGVPAEMYLANSNPEKDLEIIKNAIDNIKKIEPKKLVLISTVAVYSDTADGDENTKIDKNELEPYGFNRLYLEEWVEDNVDDYLIVRLPALFGLNLKKNFIYDYINFIPKMLKANKYLELVDKDENLNKYYILQNNGFYKCKDLSSNERKSVVAIFKRLNFNALYFTDSRNQYQFYNLQNLWSHIELVLNNKIKKINLVTQPIVVSELYYHLEGKSFVNNISETPLNYNLKTIYSGLFKNEYYIKSKEEILTEISEFIKYEKKNF